MPIERAENTLNTVEFVVTCPRAFFFRIPIFGLNTPERKAAEAIYAALARSGITAATSQEPDFEIAFEQDCDGIPLLFTTRFERGGIFAPREVRMNTTITSADSALAQDLVRRIDGIIKQALW